MKINKNYTIELEEDIGLIAAMEMAKNKIEYERVINSVGQVSTIYIVGPTVSDLIIYKDKKLKRCNHKQWTWYFRNMITNDYYLETNNKLKKLIK